MRTQIRAYRISVDTEAVARLVARQNEHRPAKFLALFGVLVLLVGAVPLGMMLLYEDAESVIAYLRAEPWTGVGVPVGFAAVFSILTFAKGSTRAARDVTQIAQTLERDWRHLTESGWVARVALWGLFGGCAIGIPIGILLATGTKPEEIPSMGGRPAIVLGFLGMTLLWTIPMAFLFRWQLIRSNRSLMRVESISPQPSQDGS